MLKKNDKTKHKEMPHARNAIWWKWLKVRIGPHGTIIQEE